MRARNRGLHPRLRAGAPSRRMVQGFQGPMALGKVAGAEPRLSSNRCSKNSLPALASGHGVFYTEVCDTFQAWVHDFSTAWHPRVRKIFCWRITMFISRHSDACVIGILVLLLAFGVFASTWGCTEPENDCCEEYKPISATAQALGDDEDLIPGRCHNSPR